jgi:hypothetical protein
LVVAEIALALVLLAGAQLMVTSLLRLRQTAAEAWHRWLRRSAPRQD